MASNIAKPTFYAEMGHHKRLTKVSKVLLHSFEGRFAVSQMVSCWTQQPLASVSGTFGAKREAWEAKENRHLSEPSAWGQLCILPSFHPVLNPCLLPFLGKPHISRYSNALNWKISSRHTGGSTFLKEVTVSHSWQVPQKFTCSSDPNFECSPFPI